ncbi:hypothetical protein L1887_28547 [Cichorium endivia]|nr:hypothetical protein L1887_28547 [Cichorium endivia]
MSSSRLPLVLADKVQRSKALNTNRQLLMKTREMLNHKPMGKPAEEKPRKKSGAAKRKGKAAATKKARKKVSMKDSNIY